MTYAEVSRPKNTMAWYWKPVYWLILVVRFLFKFCLIAWSSLAIYYSNLPWSTVRLVLAIIFAGFGIWSLWLSHKPRMPLIFGVLFIGLLIWWSTILPSQDRNWQPEVAVLPRVTINGDTVRLTNVRNFEYRTRFDFTEHYEEREVALSHLTGIDLFISYWMPGPVGHTFLSFIFDNAPPLSVSIETRPEVGQGFNPLASLFKQFELIYVVGDERDVVGVRTNYRGERVYLYHLNISAENARRLFMIYLKRINELAAQPEFYNLLSNSCTVNIMRYANKAGRDGRIDFRHYLNGLIDGYLYEKGWLNTSLPFDELRRRSFINEAAQTADKSENFSQLIRVSLPPGN